MVTIASEKVFRGIPASPGVSIGRAVLLRRDEPKITPSPIDLSQVEPELQRFRAAVKATHRRLQADQNRATREIGTAAGRIFEAHLMILEDDRLTRPVVFRNITGLFRFFSFRGNIRFSEKPMLYII